MTNKERLELAKQNSLVNIKGDLLFLVAGEQKLQNAKGRRERRVLADELDARSAKLARNVLEFYAMYSDATYKCATLRELRLDILLWWNKCGFFENYIFDFLQSYFLITTDLFEKLKEAETTEPAYEFNFKRLRKEVEEA